MNEVCKICGGTGYVDSLESKNFIGFPGMSIKCPNCSQYELPLLSRSGSVIYGGQPLLMLVRYMNYEDNCNEWYAINPNAGIIDIDTPHVRTNGNIIELDDIKLRELLNKIDDKAEWIVKSDKFFYHS